MTLVPDIPPEMPVRGNRITRLVGRVLLRLLGWKVEGEIPRLHKCLVAAAPHTSNWDFVVAMPAILAIGVRASFMMKKEAFVWPCKGLFKALGGIPTDRSAPGGVVEQVVRKYRDSDTLWLAIAPEGTRSKVEHWKSGFLRIAHLAQVPVLLVGWDYPSKTIRLGKLIEPTGDHQQDMVEIREYYRREFTAKRPELA